METKKIAGRNIRTAWMLLGGLILAVISGCATPQTMQIYRETGFLPHYEWMKPSPEGDEVKLWRQPQADLKKYNKILLERILVWHEDDAAYKGIDPTALKALVDYFHRAIVKALGTAYPVVSEAGPDVMRVRVALTQLVPTKTEMSVVTLLVPYAEIPDIVSGEASKGGLGSAPYLGDAAIEAMGLDGATGELLWEYQDRRIGKKYVVELSKGVVGATEKGFKEYGKGFTTWGYTKEALDYWALLFREWLDRFHGKAPGGGGEKNNY